MTKEDEILTAMCLWEEILNRNPQWFHLVEGAGAARDIVKSWAKPCHLAWEASDFDDSFDWEWCLKWIDENVIWNPFGAPFLRSEPALTAVIS